jgi:hypothetical protein
MNTNGKYETTTSKDGTTIVQISGVPIEDPPKRYLDMRPGASSRRG